MANYLWQLFDEQGRPDSGAGAAQQEVVLKGLLHATAHVWLWRRQGSSVEVLVQKRAASKVNRPGAFDKSAGGHVRQSETPLDAGLRKAKDELGLLLTPSDLRLAGVVRWKCPIGDTGLMENEFQWVYTAELVGDQALMLGDEVEGVVWKSLTTYKSEVTGSLRPHYIDYDESYFRLVLTVLDRLAQQIAATA